jgi:hypothetical protein
MQEEPFKEPVSYHIVELRARMKAELQEAGVKRMKRLQGLLDSVGGVVDSVTAEDLSNNLKNPVTAINLLLRIQSKVEQMEERREALLEETEEDPTEGIAFADFGGESGSETMDLEDNVA